MKLLTKESDYAIRALLVLASNPEETISSKTIAEMEKIPLQFLRRILQTLTKAGMITTREGVNGGVRLAVKAEDIPLSKIITLYQGEIQFTECLFRKKVCHNRANCVLRHRIMAIENSVANELSVVSIGTLIKDIQNNET